MLGNWMDDEEADALRCSLHWQATPFSKAQLTDWAGGVRRMRG